MLWLLKHSYIWKDTKNVQIFNIQLKKMLSERIM